MAFITSHIVVMLICGTIGGVVSYEMDLSVATSGSSPITAAPMSLILFCFTICKIISN